MDTESHEPLTPLLTHHTPAATRHDGWTGEKMAKFCELLAETAVVAEACDDVGMHISGAYALRRRNPVFAAAWDAALTLARERLADTLLARSIEGNVEYLYRDGEVVGERQLIDNRLGLAILSRLDRLAENGRVTIARREPQFPGAAPQRSSFAPAVLAGPFDWEPMVEALRTGNPDDVAGALALLKSTEVEEVEDPPILNVACDLGAEFDLSERCWFDWAYEQWMTDFPPPEGFDGEENGEWDESDYSRPCTPAETAILEADRAALRAGELAEQEELRDRWFDLLNEELNGDDDGAEIGDDDGAEIGNKRKDAPAGDGGAVARKADP